MKFLALFILLFICQFSIAQDVIPINYHKTVHLIFYSNIIDDDCSSQDIIIDSKDQVLKLTAATPIGFEVEKTVSVMTDDNRLYTFIISYSEDLPQLNYLIPLDKGLLIPKADNPKKLRVAVSATKTINLDSLNTVCERVNVADPIFDDIGTEYKKVTALLCGIWVYKDNLYFKLLLSNKSNISYDITSTNLYIQEKKIGRKSSSDPIQTKPFHVYTESKTIHPNTKNHSYIMVFEKFTISKNKKLLFEMIEQNGGRKLNFDVNKDYIIQAPFI
jgi:conjugative transposon TraN protein